MLSVHNTPAKALELEAAMIDRFRDPAVMYDLQFWTTDQCLVAPRSIKRQMHFQQAREQSEANGWPIVVRKTGGGVTPQGNGIVNVALAYSPDPSEKPTIHGVYGMFCKPLTRLLDGLGLQASTSAVPGCFCDGQYNIVVNGRKVMGTAQRWSRVKAVDLRQVVFAHALVLLDADLETSVQAVNRLHRICNISPSVDIDVHANLKQLAADSNYAIDQQQLVNSLAELYHDELAALTQ